MTVVELSGQLTVVAFVLTYLENQRIRISFEIEVKNSNLQISERKFSLKYTVKTRRLVNVRLHMMFRPDLIYIFDLIFKQMKK